MVEIKAFQALIYNFDKIKRPHKVICPPYDIITPVQARTYRRLSPYSMVHLTLPKAVAGKNRYQAASHRFYKWLKQGILHENKEPAIYFYRQEYKIDKRKFYRLGFIACLGLSGSSSIHGHEHTHIEPKEDRFKLLVKVQANLEPIFVMYSDPKGVLWHLLNKHTRTKKPIIRFRDKENNINTLWKLTQPSILRKIKMKMRNKVIFIADGHHRYEVSLNYQNLLRRRLQSRFRQNADFNYIMTYFCPIETRSLVIRPVHRLVRGIRDLPIDKLKSFFYIRKTTAAGLFKLIQSKDRRLRRFGVYANKIFYILILKNNQVLSKIDKDYRSLDARLLNYLILSKLLRINPRDKKKIIFSASVQDLIRQADLEKASSVFFLQPTRISDIIYLAKKGKKMPAKTTYFYPKVPSGLVIYKFND